MTRTPWKHPITEQMEPILLDVLRLLMLRLMVVLLTLGLVTWLL